MTNRIAKHLSDQEKADNERAGKVRRLLDKIWEDYDPHNPMMILYPVELGSAMAELLMREAQKRSQKMVVLFVKED